MCKNVFLLFFVVLNHNTLLLRFKFYMINSIKLKSSKDLNVNINKRKTTTTKNTTINDFRNIF